jgi:hypothetical protein
VGERRSRGPANRIRPQRPASGAPFDRPEVAAGEPSEQFWRFEEPVSPDCLGILDCLSEVAGIGDFQAVFKRSIAADFSYRQFRFLELDALIDSKEAVGRERDLDAVRRLLAIRERSQQHNKSPNC